MSLFSHFHIIPFLKNKELNLFYLAITITTFVESMIGIFVPIYFYNLGYSIPLILLFFLLDALFYVIFAYPVAKVVTKIGAKHAILYYINCIGSHNVELEIETSNNDETDFIIKSFRDYFFKYIKNYSVLGIKKELKLNFVPF